MRVYIRVLSGMGRTYEFDVEPSMTLSQLKTRFLERTNNKQDEEKIRFLLGEEMLEDEDRILSDHNIGEESVLQAMDVSKNGRNPFAGLGAKFVDVSNDKGLKTVEWAKTAPAWRIAAPGLCLEGPCTNQKCDAYQQRVMMSMGFTKFDIVLDEGEKPAICPLCKNYVTPTTCGFNRCWWRYQGKKESVAGEPPKKCSSDWQQVGNNYKYFDSSASGEVVWRQLILEAVENKPAQ